MEPQIDARDVLDPNAKTLRLFQARVIGIFRPTGPNAWDPFTFVTIADGAVEDIFPGVPVQTEAADAAFRMRAHGAVYRYAWVPAAADGPAAADPQHRHDIFLATCIARVASDGGIGAAAAIARTLASTPGGSMND